MIPFQLHSANNTIDTPRPDYLAKYHHWARLRAINGGDRQVRAFDYIVHDDNKYRLIHTYVDITSPWAVGDHGIHYINDLRHILIPFSPKMSLTQYRWFQTEASFPGYTGQYVKSVIGHMLLREPKITWGDTIPEDDRDEVIKNFTLDGKSLSQFLREVIQEGLITGRCFVWVDYDTDSGRAVPKIISAENVINWEYDNDELKYMIVKSHKLLPTPPGVYHKKYVNELIVFELDEEGKYCWQVYQENETKAPSGYLGKYEAVGEKQYPMLGGANFNFIPIYEIQGNYDIVDSPIAAIANKEEMLYNYQANMNHQLYGSTRYTPIYKRADKQSMDDAEKALDGKSFGDWIVIPNGAEIDIMTPGTESVDSMRESISNIHQEMARQGVRFLQHDGNVNASGVALDIRNHPNNAVISGMSRQISGTVEKILRLVLWWGPQNILPEDNNITFALNTDISAKLDGEERIAEYIQMYQANMLSGELFYDIMAQLNIFPEGLTYEDQMKKIEEEMALRQETPEMVNNNQDEDINSINSNTDNNNTTRTN